MVNFAVIGVGRMGKRHATNLYKKRVKGARLVSVCDIDENALDWCRKKFKNVETFSKLDDMLAKGDVDAVIIATPHFAHVAIAKYCVAHGVHTLIEKPVAPTISLAKEISEEALLSPEVRVGVSYNQRSNKMYIKAKKLLASGEMGEIKRVNFIITNWYRSQAYYNQGGWRASFSGEGGGCLMNQCVHQLDILQWLVGMPKSVVANAKTVDRNIKTENDVTAILEYDGFDCSFTASTHELAGVNRLEISCDKGRIVITPLKMTVYRHKSEHEVNNTTKFGYGFAPSTKSVSGYGCIRLARDILYGQQLRSVQAFVNAILGKGKPLADVSEGQRAVEIINAIYLSSYTEKRVELPVDAGRYDAYLGFAQERENSLGL